MPAFVSLALAVNRLDISLSFLEKKLQFLLLKMYNLYFQIRVQCFLCETDFRFGFIERVSYVNLPLLTVLKLTFRALALRQKEPLYWANLLHELS